RERIGHGPAIPEVKVQHVSIRRRDIAGVVSVLSCDHDFSIPAGRDRGKLYEQRLDLVKALSLNQLSESRGVKRCIGEIGPGYHWCTPFHVQAGELAGHTVWFFSSNHHPTRSDPRLQYKYD